MTIMITGSNPNSGLFFNSRQQWQKMMERTNERDNELGEVCD